MDTRLKEHKTHVFRTSHYTDDQIRRLKETANNQEREIARWFWKNPEQHIGPGRFHDMMGFEWPLTSTRRAINNLTASGILEKTEFQSMGLYGKPEYHWQWKRPSKNKIEQKELFI